MEKEILIERASMALGRNLVLGKLPAVTRMTQLSLLAVVERVPDLTFPIIRLVNTPTVVIEPSSSD